MHLRVWFREVLTDENDNTNAVERSGIVVCGMSGTLCIRDDEGKFYYRDTDRLIKSEWVSHPDDGENA